MQRRGSLAAGETYHIYNRGAHKSPIFTCEEDYERFQVLLYLLNTSEPITVRDILEQYRGRSSGEVYSEPRELPRLVDVLAYCLMPNHFHIVMRQDTDDGITHYLRKVATAYSMYFNTKYEHTGVLFQGRFKSSHIDSDPYYKWIFSYVHLNPLSLVEPAWKERKIGNMARAKRFVTEYRYSSYPDHLTNERPERAIVATNEWPDFLKNHRDLDDLLTTFTEDGPLGESVDNLATALLAVR